MARCRGVTGPWLRGAVAALLVAGAASLALGNWWRPGDPGGGRGDALLWPDAPWWPDSASFPVARNAQEAQRRHLDAAARYLAVRDYAQALHHYAAARGPLVAYWSTARPVPKTAFPRTAPPSVPSGWQSNWPWPGSVGYRAYRGPWFPPGALVYSRSISASLAREADRGIARVADILHGPRRAVVRALDLIQAGSPGEAYAILGRVEHMEAPETFKSGYAELAAVLRDQIGRQASEAVAQLEDAVARDDEASLRAALAGAQAFDGFRDFPDALDAYRRVTRSPAYQARFREMEAAAALEAAERLAAAGRARQAAAAFERAAERHEGTESGSRAAERLAELRADPDFMGAVSREEARNLLSQGASFEMNRLHEQAARLYRRVVEGHPHTEEAAAARAALERLEGGGDED